MSIPATGHKWSQWQTVSQATVLKKEVQKRICSVCKETETREIGNKVALTMKVSASSLPLKVKQTIRNFKVTEMVKGDSVQSWKSSNNRKNGYCSLHSQQLGQNPFQITFGDGILIRMSRDFAIFMAKHLAGYCYVNKLLIMP